MTADDAAPPADAQAYLPIGRYALIGDCHTAALVSSRGSVDWCCMPRFDAGSVFARLLDAGHGGFCEIRPVADEFTAARAYLEDTLVLVTTFDAAGGEVRVYDCFTTHEGGRDEPHRQLLRIVEGVRGSMDLRVRVQPRFDYGAVAWPRRHGERVVSAVGGDDCLVLSSDAHLEIAEDGEVAATFQVQAGARRRLSVVYVRPETTDPEPPPQPDAAELVRRLDETIAWWHAWASRMTITGPYAPEARRSALILKALVHAPTGAVVAAPTTSLPEAIGHERNWDYRYSWIRDSQFTVRSLAELGCEREADGFRRFLQRSAAGSADSLQLMYGVGGERRLPEFVLDLDGYRSSRPVRVGNAASEQLQLDAYGYLLELAWQWRRRGRSPDDDYWRFLLGLVDRALEWWRKPDCGIWEVRGRPRHFVHSKVMCWAAVDRGIRLAPYGRLRSSAGSAVRTRYGRRSKRRATTRGAASSWVPASMRRCSFSPPSTSSPTTTNA